MHDTDTSSESGLAQVRAWLSAEVTLRLTRGWLVAGAAAIALLAIIALD